MRQSKSETYHHYVWTTKWRQPNIPPALEPDLFRVINGEVQRCGCVTIAVNGMPDHVHLLVKFGRNITQAKLMNHVKGVSSAFLNDRGVRGGEEDGFAFRWQPGYGVFSVEPSLLEEKIAYIRTQKRHHAEGSINPHWEEPDEELDATSEREPEG